MSEDDDINKKIPDQTPDMDAARGRRDKRGTAESKQLSSGKSANEIKTEAEQAEADRTEKFRNHFECLAIITLYIVWVSIVIVGLTWLYHLIAPPCWPRLPDEQVGNIQAIVTGGIIAGIAGGHMKKRLNQ